MSVMGRQKRKCRPVSSMSASPPKADIAKRGCHVRLVPEDSDVPSQALSAQLIALLLPFWLEGLGDRSCRGEGGDLKTSVIKL